MDIRAQAAAAMQERGLKPGYYWARSGLDGDWVPMELDEHGYIYQIGTDNVTILSSLIQIGDRLEPPP